MTKNCTGSIIIRKIDLILIAVQNNVSREKMIDFDIRKRFGAHSGNSAGLDVGSHAIKMLEISGTQEKPSLASFGIKEIQGSSAEIISESVKTLAQELKITVKTLNVALTGPSVLARVISMPNMTDEELKNAVRFETEKFIPFDINECTLDFHVQGKDSREKNNVDILLAAAKKDFVLQKIKVVEAAGFSVNVVDVDSFAATNAFLKNFTSIEPDKTVALLNIGATHTNLIILKNGVIAFVRDLTIGVGDFRTMVSKKCGVDIDALDGLKGVSADKTLEIRICAKAALASLVDEIKLSFGYHENQSGSGIDQICISGGGAGFIGLEEALNEAFGAKPERWNPFQFLDINPSGIDVDEIARSSSSFAVAIGLALRGAS